MMHFTVEEENLICMYHNADRRRTIGKITAAMPGMDGDRMDAGPAHPLQAETYDGMQPMTAGGSISAAEKANRLQSLSARRNRLHGRLQSGVVSVSALLLRI